MSPHPIGLTITDLDVGGAERCLTEIACRLDRTQFEPHVFVLSPPPSPEKAKLVRRLQQADVPVTFFNFRRNLAFPVAVLRAARAYRRESISLVQAFLFHANLVARLAALAGGVPCVVCGIRVAEHRRRGHLLLDRLTSWRVDRYVCVSEAVRRFSVSSAGLPSEKLLVIPNGVDPAEYESVSSPPPLPIAEGRIVLYVGRLDHQKGVDILLRSAAAWLPQYRDVHLLLAGDGPDRARLESLARSLEIARQVCFLGFREDIPALLRAADVFVLPSRWEGMPNAVLEAMAAGLPIVATDVEGVRELLGEAAPLVPPESPDALTTHITRFLDSPSSAQTIGEANRERASSLFSWNSVVDSYQALWADLLTQKIAEKSRKLG